MMPYLPGGMPLTIAWPARGDSVLPSASYFGQTGITPVIPESRGVVFNPPSNPENGSLTMGQESIPPFEGSGVPAREFDKG